MTLVEWLVTKFGSGRRLPPRDCPEDRIQYYSPRLVPHQPKISNKHQLDVEVRQYAPRFPTQETRASTFQVFKKNMTCRRRKRRLSDMLVLDVKRTMKCVTDGGTFYYRTMYTMKAQRKRARR